MRIGVCHHMTLPGEWEDAIARAGELGFEGVELFVTLPTVGDLLDDPGRVERLRAAASSAGVALPSLCLAFLGRDRPLASLDSETRMGAVARAKIGLQRCAELGGKVALVPGAPGLDDPSAAAAYVRSLKELASTAAELGVSIAVETSYNAQETLDVLGRVGSPWVGDYFDVGNLAAREMDPVEEARKRGRHIFQAHVKGARGADLDAGTVDLEAMRGVLREIGYDGWLMLETSPGESPVEAARRNLAVMRRHFGS
mgnify:CR=1 FL=1